MPRDTLSGIESMLSPDGKLIVSALKQEIVALEKQLTKKFEEDLAKLSDDFTNAISEKNEEIATMKVELTEANAKINVLSENVKKLSFSLDALDAYQRRDSVIFSGKKLPRVEENESCPNIIRDLVRTHLKLQMDPLISTAHRIGKIPAPSSDEPDRRDIIVRFCQKDVKNRVYEVARKLKVKDLYVNESLTPTRRKIMGVLRQVVKKHGNKVKSASTFNGNCFIYMPPAAGAPPNAKLLREEINTMEKLEEFCENFLKVPVASFLKPATRAVASP